MLKLPAFWNILLNNISIHVNQLIRKSEEELTNIGGNKITKINKVHIYLYLELFDVDIHTALRNQPFLNCHSLLTFINDESR